MKVNAMHVQFGNEVEFYKVAERSDKEKYSRFIFVKDITKADDGGCVVTYRNGDISKVNGRFIIEFFYGKDNG